MVSVDVRTRSSADVRAIVAAAFFEDELTARIAERSELAVPGARELGLRPIAFAVDGQSWTLSFDGAGFAVSSGSDAATAVVCLDAQGFCDVVNDVRTPIGFFTGGDLEMPKGQLQDFLDWWVVLRSLLDGRRVYTAGSVELSANDRPVDLRRSFQAGADPAELGQRLAQTGYLHLTGVFDVGEMEALSADMDAASGTHSPDDGRSWWARTHSRGRPTRTHAVLPGGIAGRQRLAQRRSPAAVGSHHRRWSSAR